jgi:hypothetical protein
MKDVEARDTEMLIEGKRFRIESLRIMAKLTQSMTLAPAVPQQARRLSRRKPIAAE